MTVLEVKGRVKMRVKMRVMGGGGEGGGEGGTFSKVVWLLTPPGRSNSCLWMEAAP
jgi:hypothetical protein